MGPAQVCARKSTKSEPPRPLLVPLPCPSNPVQCHVGCVVPTLTCLHLSAASCPALELCRSTRRDRRTRSALSLPPPSRLPPPRPPALFDLPKFIWSLVNTVRYAFGCPTQKQVVYVNMWSRCLPAQEKKLGFGAEPHHPEPVQGQGLDSGCACWR